MGRRCAEGRRGCRRGITTTRSTLKTKVGWIKLFDVLLLKEVPQRFLSACARHLLKRRMPLRLAASDSGALVGGQDARCINGAMNGTWLARRFRGVVSPLVLLELVFSLSVPSILLKWLVVTLDADAFGVIRPDQIELCMESKKSAWSSAQPLRVSRLAALIHLQSLKTESVKNEVIAIINKAPVPGAFHRIGCD